MIGNDIARCYGGESTICKNCARRLQIAIDEQNENMDLKPYAQLYPYDDKCCFKIEAKK